MAEETIFSKIIRHEVPADIVYEDDEMMAFKDIKPSAPVHVLLIPKKVIPSLAEVTADDQALLGRLLYRAKVLAEELGIAADGYKVALNIGQNGGQEVAHLHFHILGGKDLKQTHV